MSSDLADAFPNGDLANLLRQDWISALIKETRQNRDYSSRTTDTAKWAREQVKKQTGMYDDHDRCRVPCRLTWSASSDGNVFPNYISYSD